MNLAKACAYNTRQRASRYFDALLSWGVLPPEVDACPPGSEQEALAVAAWQTKLGVEADGLCGPGTWAAAMAPLFDGRPAIPRGRAERDRIYGDPGRKPDPSDRRRLVVDPVWRDANLGRVTLGGKSYPCHKLAAVEMQRLYAKACSATGYNPRCDGVFVPRFINWNPDNEPSTHTWGIGVDFDAAHNGRKNADSAMHRNRLWPAIWEVAGWTWGGTFPTTDPMHFQRGSGF